MVNLSRLKISLFLILFCLCLWILGKSEKSVSPGPGLHSSGHVNVIKRLSDFTIGDRVELDDLDELNDSNPFLISYLRQYHVFPPSSRAYRYSTLDKGRLFYIKESRYTTGIIQSYLGNMTNGIFIEAGANNGANELSNTLVLERDYNWTGLLVEGNPIVFPRLIAAHRKSWKSDLLLSKHAHTKLVVFNQGPNAYAGKQSKSKGPSDAPVTVFAKDGKTLLFYFELLTVPLYSLVAACKFDTIDYLSLDVEGTELEILVNFPFHKVLIRTMIVKVHVMGKQKTKKLIYFLLSKGYYQHPTQPTARDLIFIHQSVMDNRLS